jgi:VAD1 Analog of StAR-related lipid transfer domain
MPYCDTFRVEVRWVARREGADDVQVEVGVVVDFQKSTLLRSKIQAGTIEESKC